MSRNRGIKLMTVVSLLCIVVLYALSVVRVSLNDEEWDAEMGVYQKLPKDISTEEPLEHIGENFIVDEGFNSNLPIVIVSFENEMAQYKTFTGGQEIVDENVEPYVAGNIKIVDNGNPNKLNYVTDEVVYESNLKAKKRGHTSFAFEKPQYLLKMFTEDGQENKAEILGMGKGDSWILNGSMADKSMLRNYLPYRLASEIGGASMSPDSRYCEVLLETDAGLEYRGVYLLMETISRGEDRVNIDKQKNGEVYTSYIVRRDRFTNFDVMLDTYGRLQGLTEEWIGVKYPSESKLTEEQKSYIEKDFSKIELIVYSENESVFKAYDRYIDVDSFVDYFLINEFFGNYDSGNHSTYMYKNSGDKLHIGPVWDFDQAMNNYYKDEMENDTLAMQTKPFYERLIKDARFVERLKMRYTELRQGVLSEKHVNEVIDETIMHLESAREREWYRWAEKYLDSDGTSGGNYHLRDYIVDDLVINRFNDDYDQEIYNIKNYLHKHGYCIQIELSKLRDLAEYDIGIENERELLLVIVMSLMLLPTLLIARKG